MPSEERCLFCGEECGEDRPTWDDTVNLTTDMLMIGWCTHELENAVGVDEPRHSWCNLDCFGKWVWQHAKHDTSARQLVGLTAEVGA